MTGCVADNPTSETIPNSEQPFVNIGVPSSQKTGTLIEVLNDKNEVIYTFTSAKSFQSVVFSIPEFVIGSTYTFKVGTLSY